MTGQEQLWYLIDGVTKNLYDIKTFCKEFTRIYDLETDYKQLSEEENNEFRELCEMTGRFSDDEDELKIRNMYYSEKEVLHKAKHIKRKLKNSVYR